MILPALNYHEGVLNPVVTGLPQSEEKVLLTPVVDFPVHFQ
jgi:hypothetical protein